MNRIDLFDSARDSARHSARHPARDPRGTSSRAWYVALVFAAAWISLPVAAQPQVWEYRAYGRDPHTGQYNKERFLSGTVSVQEKDGAAHLNLNIARHSDVCFRGDLPATVERSAENTTITVPGRIANCPTFRLVIRSDGSGGVRELQRGDKWVNDGFDHGLKAVK